MRHLLEKLRQRSPFSALSRQRVQEAAGAAPADVKDLRAPLGEADRVLLSETHLWLRRIPGRLQPKQLCRFYPRVANRLAARWNDPVAFEKLLHDLLVDGRGGRAGFSPRIVVELQVLGRFRKRVIEPTWRQRLRDQLGAAR